MFNIPLFRYFVLLGLVFDILFMTFDILLDFNFKIMSYGVVMWEAHMRKCIRCKLYERFKGRRIMMRTFVAKVVKGHSSIGKSLPLKQ